MQRTEPKSFAEIYAEAIEKAGMTDTVAQQQASYIWSEIVGPGVNRYTTKRYVVDNVLHVFITSAPLKNELRFHRAAIIKNINQRVGSEALKEIIFH